MPKTKNGGFLLDDSELTPYTNQIKKPLGVKTDNKKSKKKGAGKRFVQGKQTV